MVSLFGLKFGGDKKSSHNDKPRSKAAPVEQQPQRPQSRGQQRNRLTKNPNGSRPATSHGRGHEHRDSTASGINQTWKSPYAEFTSYTPPYLGGTGSTTSLNELMAPRAPGLGQQPRFHSSDGNLRARFAANGSTSSLGLSAPITPITSKGSQPGTQTRPGAVTPNSVTAPTAPRRQNTDNSVSGNLGVQAFDSRPGTATSNSMAAPRRQNTDNSVNGNLGVQPVDSRPSTATSNSFSVPRRQDTDNSLNGGLGVQQTLDSRPGTPQTGRSPPKASLEQSSGHIPRKGSGDSSRDVYDSSHSTTNGYPSPPASIINGERSFSPTKEEGQAPSRRGTGPSGLRNVDTAPESAPIKTAGPALNPHGPRALPSPATSVVARSSDGEDPWDLPVIRNVHAHRDTMTFHTPRRQSFSMKVVDVPRKPMVEGLVGNFSGFDFGETVRRGSVSTHNSEKPKNLSIDTTSTSMDFDLGSSDAGVRKPLSAARTESPLRSVQSTEPRDSQDTAPSARERNTSDAASFLSLSATTSHESRRQQSPAPAQSPVPQSAPAVQQRQRDPSPLTSAPPTRPPAGPVPNPPTSGSRPAYAGRKHSATSPVFVPYPGARSASFDTRNSSFFLNRMASDPNTRQPPTALSVPAPLVSRPSPTNGPYKPYMPVRTSSDQETPAETTTPRETVIPGSAAASQTPAQQSPLARPPMEGDFPVTKGLPRGRRPPALESHAVAASGLSPRHPQKQATYPSVKPDSFDEPAPPSTGFSKWDDLDMADRHRSAIPPPLSPFKAPTPGSPDDMGLGNYTSSPIASTPPSLPSPSFQSLEKSISSSSESLARSFEVAAMSLTNGQSLEESYSPRPLISPVQSEFGTHVAKAPPRPNPITVPPSGGASGGTVVTERGPRTPRPVVDQFSPGFI